MDIRLLFIKLNPINGNQINKKARGVFITPLALHLNVNVLLPNETVQIEHFDQPKMVSLKHK
jgi:hypothetical protein